LPAHQFPKNLFVVICSNNIVSLLGTPPKFRYLPVTKKTQQMSHIQMLAIPPSRFHLDRTWSFRFQLITPKNLCTHRHFAPTLFCWVHLQVYYLITLYQESPQNSSLKCLQYHWDNSMCTEYRCQLITPRNLFIVLCSNAVLLLGTPPTLVLTHYQDNSANYLQPNVCPLHRQLSIWTEHRIPLQTHHYQESIHRHLLPHLFCWINLQLRYWFPLPRNPRIFFYIIKWSPYPPSQFHLYREFSIKHSPFHRYFENPLLPHWEFRCQLFVPKNLSIVIYSNITHHQETQQNSQSNVCRSTDSLESITYISTETSILLPINPLPRTCLSSFPPTFLCWTFTHCYQETPTKLSMERLPFHWEPIITSAQKN